MNLPIVDFQTAKDLKELGFDWSVSNMYRNNETKRLYGLSQEPMDVNSQKQSVISAPTQAEVVKWLRDEKGIFIQLMLDSDGWTIYIDTKEKADGVGSYELFNTYEQAELEGIKKAIQTLKNIQL